MVALGSSAVKEAQVKVIAVVVVDVIDDTRSGRIGPRRNLRRERDRCES